MILSWLRRLLSRTRIWTSPPDVKRTSPRMFPLFFHYTAGCSARWRSFATQAKYNGLPLCFECLLGWSPAATLGVGTAPHSEYDRTAERKRYNGCRSLMGVVLPTVNPCDPRTSKSSPKHNTLSGAWRFGRENCEISFDKGTPLCFSLGGGGSGPLRTPGPAGRAPARAPDPPKWTSLAPLGPGMSFNNF